MIQTITPILNSFLSPLTLTCCKCEADIGIVPKGFGLLFVRTFGVPRDFIAIAPEIDWCICRQCGVVATPMMVDPEMFDVTRAYVRSFIEMHTPTLDEFRREFPLTPAYRALIKEEIEIRFS